MGCTSCQKTGPLRMIIEGWVNYIFPNKEIEIIAKGRAITCSTCPKNILNVCNDCKCPIPTKTRTKEKTCDKWKD